MVNSVKITVLGCGNLNNGKSSLGAGSGYTLQY